MIDQQFLAIQPTSGDDGSIMIGGDNVTLVIGGDLDAFIRRITEATDLAGPDERECSRCGDEPGQ